jgi:hypothetical protein
MCSKTFLGKLSEPKEYTFSPPVAPGGNCWSAAKPENGGICADLTHDAGLMNLSVHSQQYLSLLRRLQDFGQLVKSASCP